MTAPEPQTGKTIRIDRESTRQSQTETSKHAHTNRPQTEQEDALKEPAQNTNHFETTDFDGNSLENYVVIDRTGIVEGDHDHIKSFLEDRLCYGENNEWDQ